MTEDEYGIGKAIDDDYIDVETRRADLSGADTSEDIDRRSRASQNADTADVIPDVSHILDDGNGNGSASALSETIDDEAIIEHDGRASTRTFFYAEEAPDGRQREFKRLLDYQEDKWSGMKNAQRKADRMRTVHNFCSALDMSSYHKERVKLIAEEMNMSHMGPFSSDKVILGIISLVANEDNRFIRDEDAYKDLLDRVDTNLSAIRTIRRMVRERSEQYG